MGVAVESKDAIRSAVVNYRIGIFGRWNTAEYLKGLEIEHHYRRVVSRCGESVTGMFGYCDTVGTLDTSYFTNEFAVVGIDDHHAIFSTDKQAMVRRIGNYVVPASVATDIIFVCDAIGPGRLGDQH